ncbi:MAG TPA: fibronectin type III domain-containing protein [Streptosporangiaceae bacterium]|jgi:hypothetical protein
MKRVVLPAISLAAVAALGTAAAAASPASAGVRLGDYNNATQVTNHPGGTSLAHDKSAYQWYSCGDYNHITTPEGTVSAYPYGPGNWTWKNVSDSKWVSATENNAERWPVGKIQFLFTNWSAVSTHTAQVSFDCSSLYPGYGVTGMEVQSVLPLTSTTATITWQLHSSDLGESNILPSSTWHVEYGSTPGDYTKVSASQTYGAEGPHGADPRSVTLSGLTPFTTYHFRVVLDIHAYGDFGNLQPSFTDPNNTFTTAWSS